MATAMVVVDDNKRGIADVATMVDDGRVASDVACCGAANRW